MLDRLADRFEISIDEVAWRKGHRYLTLVGDHRRGCVAWGTEGKGQAAAERAHSGSRPISARVRTLSVTPMCSLAIYGDSPGWAAILDELGICLGAVALTPHQGANSPHHPFASERTAVIVQ